MTEMANALFFPADLMSDGIDSEKLAHPETIKPANLSRFLLDEIKGFKDRRKSLKRQIKTEGQTEDTAKELRNVGYQLDNTRMVRSTLNALRFPGLTFIDESSRYYAANHLQMLLEGKSILNKEDINQPSPIRTMLAKTFRVDQHQLIPSI